MTSRQEILGRIRTRLGRNAANTLDGTVAIDNYLASRPSGPIPRIEGDVAVRFREKSEKLSSTVEIVESFSGVPQAVARYLAAQLLKKSGVCWPELAELPWEQAGITMVARATTGHDLIGITSCFCALAETGTLVLCSGPNTPAATSLLPETHIAVVPASRILATMEQAWNLIRSEFGKSHGGELPRAINFISGPSRTGDIEQTIVLGAHGPYRVHILIVDDR